MLVRCVKAGLGGHDAGVSWVEEGVENTSSLISKRGRLALSECPTFSGFWCKEGDFRSETKTGLEETHLQTTHVKVTFHSLFQMLMDDRSDIKRDDEITTATVFNS